MSTLTDPVTVTGIMARLVDEYWWRRALRKVCGRKFEHGAIRLGVIHKGEWGRFVTLMGGSEAKRKNSRYHWLSRGTMSLTVIGNRKGTRSLA
ncbi:hypothetical protein EBAPG3_002060 [Nitrosospira lacus]|uniref:Uncharacterized protein n=2 Tax=Nitrosospira lacus TaxID=1288494 RepID=A0A1W6SLI1_9PROT|nr:hypothetical protein EBAPG3_002060 [Nitrosospira lacus]